MDTLRVAAIAIGAVVGLGIANGAQAQPVVAVVMSGLDNPRGIAFAPNGALYVAEAGRGGTGPCQTSGAMESRCYGPSGAISRLWKGLQERVVQGLPSHALPDGTSASGPNDISFQGTGGAYVTLGLGGGPAFQDFYGAAGELMGTIIHVAASGQWRMIADVASWEFAANPDGGAPDSNPYGILAEPGGRYVADAGANALFRVRPNGTVETIAVFPSRASGRGTDSVPTAVARGPDGALYVSELTGVPFAQGAANIYRVVAGQAPTVFAAGFKTIMDIAFDADGNLYVVENAGGPVFFPPDSGRLLRVAPNGARSVVLGGLDRPTAVAVGADGAIYATNHGTSAGTGEVLKIAP